MEQRFNFDEIIERKNTNSLKYDFARERQMPEDILPLWVADMDFKAPPAVIDALVKRAQHGIFGYSDSKIDYFHAIQGWYDRRFNWSIEPSWLVKTPGVVFAIATAIRALSAPGDAVIIQQPVYYPFAKVIEDNDRQLVVSELIYRDGMYEMDFDDFEAQVRRHSVKLFILCSPHNPVGRVWTRDELIRIGDICLKHDVRVIADEIHADFVFPGYKHEIFARLKPEFLDQTITCTAPSKTFNLAGLQVSNLLIKDPLARQAIRYDMLKSGYSQLNSMGLAACQAAYEQGDSWLDQLVVYLTDNLSLVRRFLDDRLPEIRLVEPQGTYLLWLDCTGLGLTEAARNELITHKARLWLDTGSMFGPSGAAFERINMACPRSVLQESLERLERAIRHA